MRKHNILRNPKVINRLIDTTLNLIFFSEVNNMRLIGEILDEFYSYTEAAAVTKKQKKKKKKGEKKNKKPTTNHQMLMQSAKEYIQQNLPDEIAQRRNPRPKSLYFIIKVFFFIQVEF